MGPLSGETTLSSHINLDHLLKERICSTGANSFLLEKIPFWEDEVFPGVLPGKQTGSHKNCLPLKTWWKEMEVYPYTLRFNKQQNTQTSLSLYKVASFRRSQCEGCSIIIYLMALYDYYLKYGIFKEDISNIFLNCLFESNPLDEASKLVKSLTDFHESQRLFDLVSKGRN